MNVLVTYFSQTGNTEKVASAIYEEASQANDADLKKLEEVHQSSLKEYDLVFIGSPIHAGSIAKETKAFLDKLPALPKIKLAGFITHSAPSYPQQTLEQMTAPFAQACKDKEMEYQGCFDCQGYLADHMHAPVQKMRKVNDEEWQGILNQMSGHPNVEDQTAAKEFAKSVIG